MAKIGIILMVICTFFTAFGQFFLKKGMSDFNLFSYPLYLGILLYAIGAVLMIAALRNGSLSVLYPIMSLTFIWVFILSYFLLNEEMNVMKFIATGTILYGVSLTSRGKK